MMQFRRADERGHANHGWLDSHHTFSFADYYDPAHMGWSALRVINDDVVSPDGGFPTHAHREMEIISYVLDGALEHKDSLGTGSVIVPGDVQLMSAGTGIAHSEFNHSATEQVHFLQIWVHPKQSGLTPAYQQRHYPDTAKRGRLHLLVSPDGRDDSLLVHQDLYLYAALIEGKEKITWTLEDGRKGYLHVARGEVTLNGHVMRAGDGVKLQGALPLVLDAGLAAEILLFDLPG
ncbi:pirin family protein [Paludibacterium yongneupense]|uniref:pirin family protein n=1 Tax=Paludibacterium yongneupense TaxID=400061 RepID=UPI0004036E99|nr:pirin family protein [Paludibacterium yongneupense]